MRATYTNIPKPSDLASLLSAIVLACRSVTDVFEVKTSSREYGTKITLKFADRATKKEVKRIVAMCRGHVLVKNAEREKAFWSGHRRVVIRLKAHQAYVDRILHVLLNSDENTLAQRASGEAVANDPLHQAGLHVATA